MTGLLTSHQGADFTALCDALARQGYLFGALEIDAAAFLPQSRPRVFVLAVREPPAAGLTGDSRLHTPAVRAAQARLPRPLKARWIWWSPRRAPCAQQRPGQRAGTGRRGALAQPGADPGPAGPDEPGPTGRRWTPPWPRANGGWARCSGASASSTAAASSGRRCGSTAWPDACARRAAAPRVRCWW
ncbi:MAG: hypothetical protein WDN45_16765 [Caulobacteraceae bacterium]